MEVGQASGNLLEREDELAAIDRLLASARGGRGRTLAIEGEPGIGKSSLLAAARAASRERGMRDIAARASELEHGFPFGVVRQLLEPLTAAASPDEQERLFAGAAGLAREILADTPLEADSALDAPRRALHGLHWLTVGIAEEEPLVVVVDDVQWIDEASLHWLAYMARRIDDLPIAVVVATRHVEPGARPVLDRLLSAPGTEVLRPGPLHVGAVETLAEALLGEACEADFGRACHRATGGNPFLVVEALRELARQGAHPVAADAHRVAALPASAIQRAVTTRLDELPPACRDLVRAVAVMGDGVPTTAAARLARIDPLAAADLGPALESAGILEARDGRLGFTHAIVRATVEAGMSARERTDGHRRARDQLLAEGAPAERIALHASATEPRGDPVTADALLRAARTARARGALDSAHAYLERALREPPPDSQRAAVLAELGAVEVRLIRGRPFAHLGAALEADEPAGSSALTPEQRAAAARDLAAIVAPRKPARAMRLLGEAVETLEDERLRCVLAATAWGLSFSSLPVRRAFLEQPELSAVARAPRKRGRGSPSRSATVDQEDVRTEGMYEELEALRGAMAAAFSGQAGEARAHAATVLARGVLLHAVDLEAVAHYTPALVLIFADDLDAALEALDATMTAARTVGSEIGCSVTSHIRALARWRRGELAEVEADAAGARPDLTPSGMPLGQACMASVLIERGDVEGAARLHADAGLGEVEAVSPQATPILASRAHLRLAQGRPESALVELDACAQLEADWGITTPALSSWRADRALALAALGRSDEAASCAREAVAQARAFGAARPLGIALRATGLVAGELDALEEAERVLSRSSARLEHARAAHDLGAALRRRGRRRDARDRLRRAHELARSCGATALEAAAADELRAIGDRPRPAGAHASTELTAAERRAAVLAAQGQSNREIAQALFLSEKTIERHLSGAYRKLGVKRRSQLAGVLHER